MTFLFLLESKLTTCILYVFLDIFSSKFFWIYQLFNFNYLIRDIYSLNQTNQEKMLGNPSIFCY
ncbi:hypothetical protein D7142_04805 [Enterococcus faecalis]|nr:hypothetical protein [Enterococcus faecalis]